MIGTIMARRAVRNGFAALNNHDLGRFMQSWREEGTFVYPGNISASGTYRGRQAVEGWFARFLEQYPTIEFDVRDVCVRNAFDVVGDNVIAVQWDLHVVNRKGRDGRNTGVTTVTIRRGKAVAVKDYLFDTSDEWRRTWGES